MAGYSGTPLAKKLGVKPGHSVALVGAPSEFSLELPEGCAVARFAGKPRSAKPRDVVVLFCKRRAQLAERFAPWTDVLSTAGGLWVAWPKKSSGVATDLSDGEVRGFGLASGLVDNKVCAIDDTWSGLRFVRRLRDR